MEGSQWGEQSFWAQQTLAELSGLLLTLDLCTGRSCAPDPDSPRSQSLVCLFRRTWAGL